MRVDRAWVRLSSGRRLNLLDIKPDTWSDEDLATGLSRTYWITPDERVPGGIPYG